MADVSADLKNWSNTASNNNPSGTTTVGTGLDDNLRQIQATVKQDLAHVGANIASATTTDLGAIAGLFHTITGTTTITSFGTVSAGIWKILTFSGALTITHNATSMICPGGGDMVIAADNTILAESLGSGNWKIHPFGFGSLYVNDGTAALPAIANIGDLNTGFWFPAADTVAIATGGTERVRIDTSGRVGFGRTPTSYRIEASGGIYSTDVGAGGNPAVILRGHPSLDIGEVGTLTNHPVTFITNSAERVRIDTSGNVGVGTTAGFTNIALGMEIQNSAAVAGLRIERTSTGASAAELFTASGTVNLYTVGGAYPLVLGVNNTEYMRLSGTGVPTYVAHPIITNANTVVSTVRTSSGNGYGSTNNKIRRFGTPDVNQGSDITYADSATDGATFTINTAGVYAISYTDSFTVSDHTGITLNSAQLTTAIQSVTASTRLAMNTVWNANASALCSWTGPLAVNDVIRAHTGGSTQSSYTHFTITRVA